MKSLENAKRGNLGQILLRTARLYNELAVTKVQQEIEPRFTVAHTTLFPHLDLEGTRPSLLARRLGTSKQAVGQLVKELEKMDMVTRIPDPEDGRARLVVFTDRGKASMIEGLGVLKQVEREAAEALTEPVVEQLKANLETLLDYLEQGGE